VAEQLHDAVDEDGIMIGYRLLREDDPAAGRYDRVYFEMQRRMHRRMPITARIDR
jgi:hypothetical protein